MDEEPIPPQVLLQQAEFVRSLARGLLGDEHSAEDVVQETWIAALEKPPKHVVNVRAWLGTVARNFAWRMRRSEARREQRERATARPEAFEATGGNNDTDTLARETTLRLVTEAVLALDEPFRSTILLRYFEGLDAAHIAVRQAVSIATVRSRLQRALAKLRERLDREHGGDRSAWSIGLVGLVGSATSRAFPLQPVSTTRATPLAPSTSLLGLGVIVMSLKMKLAIVAGVLLLGWILWEQPWRHAEPVPALASTRDSHSALHGEQRSPPTAGTEPSSNRAAIADSPVPSGTGKELEPFGSLAVHAVYAETGLPAVDVHLTLLAWGESEPYLNPLSGVTDSNGDFHFERVHSGQVEVFEHHGTGESLDVAAGRETKMLISIPRGVTVEGVVVDRAGIPVSNASLWISGPHNVWEWIEIAATNRDGAFRLQDVKASRQIAAREDRHGPSMLYPVHGEVGETCKLRIVLGDEAARIEGRVLDQDGAPIAGARVRLSDAHEGRGIFRGDLVLGTPVPELRTDEAGRYAFAGVSPSSCSIDFRAAGFAPTWLNTVIENGVTTTHDITLRPGVKVHGVVRTTQGDVVSGAWVRVGDFGDDFRASQARTSADGSFRLSSVQAGKIPIQVTSIKAGKASGNLAGKPGDDLEWNPTITLGERFSGRLVDERGEALSGWSVHTSATIPNQNDPFQCWTKTDADGRFVIDNCPEQLMHFEIVEPPNERAMPGLVLESMRPGTEEQVIRVPDSARLTSTILGALVDEDGVPLSARIFISDERSSQGGLASTSKESGAFHCGPFTAGKYALVAEIANEVRYRLGDYELTRDQKLDLGRIVLARPGALAVSVKPGVEFDLRSIYVSIRPVDRGDRDRGKSGLGKNLLDKVELAPGAYFLRIDGNTIASASYPVEIRSGEVTRVEVDPQPGVMRSCRITSAPGSPALTKVIFEVIDADGTILEESVPLASWGDPPAVSISFTLAPGEYTVRATASDGRRGETKLTVDREESRIESEIQVR